MCRTSNGLRPSFWSAARNTCPRFGIPVSTSTSCVPSSRMYAVVYGMGPRCSGIRNSPGRISFATAGRLQDGEIAFELVRRDVGLVGVPLLALVADEVLVDVVAEALSHHLGALGHAD